MAREMKDSSIAWIGQIPKEWDVCRLKDIISFINGYAFNSDDFSRTKAVPVIRQSDISSTLDLCDAMKVDYNADLCSYEIQDGDIIIGMSGSIGKMCRVASNIQAYINQRVGIIRSKHNSFVYYLLYTEGFEEHIKLMSMGTAVLNISAASIGTFTIPLPPLPTQRLIANFLEEKCGEIDELVALQEKMIDELKAYKQSVITETVTKGLNPNAKMKDSGVDWIGEIPEDWSKDKIFRVFTNIGSGTTPKATEDSNFAGDINWIQSGDINGGIMNSCKNKISQAVLEKYSALKVYKAPFIIVAMYGASVGNISVSTIDGCVNQACCVMSDSLHCFEYLFYTIKSAKDYLIYKAEGGGQPNISQDKLKNLWLPVPPLSEQHQIATYLDEKCSEIDSLISIKQKKIEELKDYKKSLIYEYVTGKKQVV